LSIRGNSSAEFIVNDAKVVKKGCYTGSKASAINLELVGVSGDIILFDFEFAGNVKASYSSRPVRKIVSGDEECICKHSDCGVFPNSKGIVGREYYSDKYMHQWEFGTSFGTRRNSVAFIPLGPRLDFGLVSWADEPSTDRMLLFNLIISPTTYSRKKLVAFVNSSAFTKSLGHSVPFVLNIAKQWHGNFGANYADTFNSTQYKNVLKHSVFTLCPTGEIPFDALLYKSKFVNA
jgi:hypothetical protein